MARRFSRSRRSSRRTVFVSRGRRRSSSRGRRRLNIFGFRV